MTLLCAGVIWINPFGFRLYLLPFNTVSLGVLQQSIAEWASPNFHIREAQIFIWLLLAIFGAAGLSRRRIDLTDLLSVSAFAYLSF